MKRAALVCLAFLVPMDMAIGAESCKLSEVEVKVARWYDEQGLNMYFTVVGELVNNCNAPTGVQVRFVGRDAKGNLVSVSEPWPASVRNIPPHSRSPFQTTAFRYDRAIKTLSAEAIQVKQW